MMLTDADRKSLEELDFRLRIVLPEEYQDTYQQMTPAPMRSAGLKYGDDGLVAWDKIWGSFCDLAMAGGPPHKGTLLEAGTKGEIDARRDRYQEVVAEICRGGAMVTGLAVEPSPAPGWIRVECDTKVMTGWLLRAITMENVAVRAEGRFLDLPAAPHFRLDKEIKNVITVIAKTCHYWAGHMPRAQHHAIADLFASLDAQSPLIEPALADRHGWRGVGCASVQDAVWMMRALVVSNVLARREDTVLFVPINEGTDPGGERVSRALASSQRLRQAETATSGSPA
jgi:hypothetical protein